MPVPAARWAREKLGLAVILVLLAASHQALGDLLSNELPGESSLTVTVRGAVGNHYRPGRPVLLKITIQNDGEPFEADVRVRETRSGGEALFRGPARITLAKGANSIEILAAPAGGAAGTVLEVLRLPADEGEGEGEPVFRGDLTRVLLPLGRGEEFLVAVGVEACPLPDVFVHAVTEPRDLPVSSDAYASVDIVVLERVRRDEVSRRQAEALVNWVRSGGRVVFASFRAMAPFERELFGEEGTPRTREDWGRVVPGSFWCQSKGVPSWTSFSFGLGHANAYAAEPADGQAWRRPPWLPGASRAAKGDPWVDAATFRELAPDRPFSSAADRAKTVVLIAALAACVAVAVFIRKRRALAAAVVGGGALAWAIMAALIWSAPVGAARVVRVRAFTGYGRAEIVTDTAVLTAFGKEARIGVETSTGPAFPVTRREGELLSVPYELARRGDSWLISELRARKGTPAVVRSRLARGLDEEAESLRTRTLARGDHVGVEKLPGGRCRLTFEGEEPSADVRYLIERFTPSADNLAWLWIEGEPEGVRLLPEGRIDPAPGSGTLVIAAVPLTQKSQEGPGADP